MPGKQLDTQRFHGAGRRSAARRRSACSAEPAPARCASASPGAAARWSAARSRAPLTARRGARRPCSTASSPRSTPTRARAAAAGSGSASSACRSPPTPRSRATSPSSWRASARPREQDDAPARAARRDPLQRRRARARGRARADRATSIGALARARRRLAPRGARGRARSSSRSRAARPTTASCAAAHGVRIGGGAARTYYLGLGGEPTRGSSASCRAAWRRGSGDDRSRATSSCSRTGRSRSRSSPRPTGAASRPATWSRRAGALTAAAADPHRAALREEARGARAAGAPRGAPHRDRHARGLVPLADDRASLAARVPAARHRRRAGAAARAALVVEPGARRRRDRAAARRFRRRPTIRSRSARRLEAALDAGRDALAARRDPRPLGRALAVRAARGRSPEHETRWLNLAGFLLRPGFGDPGDELRIGRLWRVLTTELRHPRAIQGRAEWWNLWKRIAGGLTAASSSISRSASRRRCSGKGQAARAAARAAGAARDVAGDRRAASGCRRSSGRPAGRRSSSARRRRGRATEQELWALARLGARVPIYGPLNCVVGREVATRWVERLLAGRMAARRGLRVRGDAARARDRRPRSATSTPRSASASPFDWRPRRTASARRTSSASRSRSKRGKRPGCSTSRCPRGSGCLTTSGRSDFPTSCSGWKGGAIGRNLGDYGAAPPRAALTASWLSPVNSLP